MITAAATRPMPSSLIARDSVRLALERRGTCVAARELPRDTATARAALQRELHRFACARFGFARRWRRGDAEGIEPTRDRRQIVFLAERIERDPQPEALGQRDLLLDRLAGMRL